MRASSLLFVLCVWFSVLCVAQPVEITPEKLVGTWKLTKIVPEERMPESMLFIFKQDGSIVATFQSTPKSEVEKKFARYEIKENKLIITEEQHTPEIFPISMPNENELIISEENAGMSLTFIKQSNFENVEIEPPTIEKPEQNNTENKTSVTLETLAGTWQSFTKEEESGREVVTITFKQDGSVISKVQMDENDNGQIKEANFKLDHNSIIIIVDGEEVEKAEIYFEEDILVVVPGSTKIYFKRFEGTTETVEPAKPLIEGKSTEQLKNEIAELEQQIQELKAKLKELKKELKEKENK